MAHGLPDWYRGVDIAYQALSQMIIRPKYGAGVRATASVAATASEETTLITVAGKGVTYGGFLVSDGVDTQKADQPRIYLDDVLIFSLDFHDLNVFSLNVHRSAGLFERKYDDDTFRYVVALGYGYTFETSLKIAYLETYGRTPAVRAEVHYALV